MSQQINLFNPAFRRQKKHFSAVTMAQALAVIVFASSALIYYLNHQISFLTVQAGVVSKQLAQSKTRLANAGTEFAPRKKDARVDAELQNALAELRFLQDAGGILKKGDFGNHIGYSAYFRAFARQSVNGLWLTGLIISGADNEIGLQGRAQQAELIPVYIKRLANETVMNGKSFNRLEIGQGDAAKPAAAVALASVPPPVASFVEFRLLSSNEKSSLAFGEAKK